MKKTILASILGLAISTASSHGQALYFFDTYIASSGTTQGVVTHFLTDTPVTAAEGYKADLLWQAGSDSGDLGLAIPIGNDAYVHGGTVSFDDAYIAFTPITFTIEVWQGLSYVDSTSRGSITWTEPGQELSSGYDRFQVLPNTPIFVVPEPTTVALAGIGLAGLLLIRKRA